MRYSKPETLNLSAHLNRNNCLEDLNQLILNEGYSDVPPVSIDNKIVLNMDCVESELAKEEARNQNMSMDSAFVIVSNDKSIKEILLVEFRFNYQSLTHLKRDDLLNKVSGSTNALKNTLNIHQRYIFVFSSNLKEQAVRWLFRKYPRVPNNYVATDIAELKSLLF
jgi:hypothetical protein